MASPLMDLLGKGKFVWTDTATVAFERVKSALCSAPVLRLPDFTRPFAIEPDASANAVGAVLLQSETDDVPFHPVAYLSKKFIAAKRNYPAPKKELLAIFKAVMKWRPYIDGHPTTVYTDHKPLTSLHT